MGLPNEDGALTDRTSRSPMAVEQRGLTSEEAAQRLRRYGPNATADVEAPPWRILLGKFVAPVPCLLEAAIVLQLLLGEYIEASVIGVLLVFNAALGFFQEGRAKATLSALKSRLALSTSVLRDGAWSVVPAASLVPGDILKLTLGSVVAADVRITEGAVQLDQSMLTGESMPVEAGPGYETFAGALVRRGEAVAEVTATGAKTRFGRTADLVRTAHVTSTQQKAVLRVVLHLAAINGALALLLIAYAWYIWLPFAEIIPLALIAILASVPVALPATFTLATAVGAQALGKHGVLPTRLSAVDEAASMNVLCVDKTGTLTSSELAVAAVVPISGHGESEVLMWARLASSDGGLDPVDAAVRAAAARFTFDAMPVRDEFIPFDPAAKMAEATVAGGQGDKRRVVKGAFAYVTAAARPCGEAAGRAAELEERGYRVLAVAIGAPSAMDVIGLLALSDPPRPDAAGCIAQLRSMGVRVVMVTGDAPATAAAVARAIGLEGAIASAEAISESVRPEQFAVFAGVLPEHKFTLVKAFQRAGYTVGMCGDGANDAPALRQAQLGIAVSTATDVAKSAAGLVLTEPGLSGIVGAVTEGRFSAYPHLHAPFNRAQSPPGDVSGRRSPGDGPRHPDANAGGIVDDHRRFSRDVLDHGQRASVRETKYLEGRQSDDRRSGSGLDRSGLLRWRSSRRKESSSPRTRAAADADHDQSRVQRTGDLLCRPRAAPHLVVQTEHDRARFIGCRSLDRADDGLRRDIDGAAAAPDHPECLRCRHRVRVRTR